MSLAGHSTAPRRQVINRPISLFTPLLQLLQMFCCRKPAGQHVAVWVVGVFQVLIGGGTMALGVWALLVRSYVGSWAAGIWGGGWVLVSGLLGTCGCCCRGAEICFLSLNILASIGLWFGVLLISLYGAFMDAINLCSNSYTWAQYLYDLQSHTPTSSQQFCMINTTGVVVNVILAFVAILLLVVTVISSLLGCLAVCCATPVPPRRLQPAKDVEEVRLVNNGSEPLGIDDHADITKPKKFGWRKSLKVRPAPSPSTNESQLVASQQLPAAAAIPATTELQAVNRQLLPPLGGHFSAAADQPASDHHLEPTDVNKDLSAAVAESTQELP